MSKSFHIECCICALKHAKEEAKMAGMNWYFCEEIDRIIDIINRNEENNEKN